MIHIITRNQRQYTSEDIEYLTSKVLAFCDLYHLLMFYNSVQLKHVGISSYDLQNMLADISRTLSNLKMVYKYRGKKILPTPGDLFSRYTEFVPLLSPNALTWSFCLVTLFFHALPLEL